MIIGLSGYARSGKDTVAQILVDNYGFTRLAFADKIKELLVEINPKIHYPFHSFNLRDIVFANGWDYAKSEPEIRELLQNLGVGARKVFGENHWIVETFKNLDNDKNYVVTDVRFTNEAKWIKEIYNGHIWRVERPGISAVNDHISEHDLNIWNFDSLIDNSGSIEDLADIIAYDMESLYGDNI